jgi:hypothetical protein
MEKNITAEFTALVGEKLVAELNLARETAMKAQAKDPNVKIPNAVALRYDIADVLRSLGAKNVVGTIRVNKDYAWLDFSYKEADGFYHRMPSVCQRRQAKKSELAAMKALDGQAVLADASCIAGLYTDGETTQTSFKWDSLITVDGETITYTGKVRKYDAKTGDYDAPVEA